MQLHTLPRAYLNVSLHVARLPVTAIELLAGHSTDSSWPPSLAFESFEANVRQVVGSLLRDDQLTEQGRLSSAKVAELRQAARLEATADQRRMAADRTFEQRQLDAEEKRAQADERSAERQASVERREQQEKAKVASRTRAQAQRAGARAAERQQRLTEQERAVRAETVTTQRAAVRRKKSANSAAAEVVDLDKKISRSKSARGTRR
jgi:hypothetical protein